MVERRVRVLIVEDEAFIALTTAWALEEDGHEVCGIAADAGEALAIAGRERPDVALVDLRLADGMTGLGITRELYARHGTTCILTTAYPRELWSGLHGAWARLRKPYDPRRLGEVVAYCLALAGGGRPEGVPPIGLDLLP